MKLLNTQEYKKQYPDARLHDYISYLEQKQKEAEEVLESAKTFSLNDIILEQIESQSRKIVQILELIESRLGQIILNSVSQLSLEELQSYFDPCEEKKEREEKRSKLMEKKQLIETSLLELNDKIEDILYKNGRSQELYQQTDATTFFMDNITPERFFWNLLSGKNSENLKNDIRTALELEIRFQNISLKEDEINELVQQILCLLEQSRKIIEYSLDAKEELSCELMTENGIGRILSSNFDSKTPVFLAYDLMSFSKMKTEFYQLLPLTLQKRLQKEHFIGETYQILKQTYQEYKQGKESVNEDIVQKERKEQHDLEEELSKVIHEITCIDIETETQNQFLSDIEAMRSVLTTIIQSTIEPNQASMDEINVAICETEETIKALKEELLEAYHELSFKDENLKKAKMILKSPDYHSFFQAVEKNNMRKIYKALGVDVTEKVVIPFVETEEKRYQQIDAMISIQTKLEEVYNLICEKKEKSNFLTQQLPSYKGTLKRLNDRYQQVLEYGFKTLQENNLFYIYAPQISMESTMENVICLTPKVNSGPQNFDEVNGLKQIFWNMNGGIGTKTRKKFLLENPSFVDWDSYVQFLMQVQEEFVTKLFSFSKDEEGYYHFQLTVEERKTLLAVQKTIMDIAKSTYQERKDVRKYLESVDYSLDSEKKAQLESILGKGNNLSRENLATYIENTEQEVINLKKLLLSNKILCIELDIPIMSEEEFELPEASHDLEFKIKNLNIEGVKTLQDAITYRDILVGLNEYTIFSSGEIKQFCLTHKLVSK